MTTGVLKGRKALITGASRGIGTDIARLFAQEGAELVLAARSASGLETVAAEIRQLGATVHTVPTDMGNVEQVKALAKAGIDKAGGLDIVVSNAAISGPFRPTIDITLEEWDEVYRTNYLGPLVLLKELGGHLANRPGANVIIVSSIRGLGGTPFNEPYASTKAALNHLIRTLAVEWGPVGVRVNGILPGPVATDMTTGFFQGNQPLYDWYAGIAPLAGWTMPEELAGPTLFLASDAARRVNGHLLVVDAGLSAINADTITPPAHLVQA